MPDKVPGCSRSFLLALTVCALVTPEAVRAQPRSWLASVSYESSHLVVPVLFVASGDDAGREWSLGLTGWTLSADMTSPAGERRKRHLFVRLTPVNAHAGNIVYRNGVRDGAAEFRALNAEAGAGLDIAHTDR